MLFKKFSSYIVVFEWHVFHHVVNQALTFLFLNICFWGWLIVNSQLFRNHLVEIFIELNSHANLFIHNFRQTMCDFMQTSIWFWSSEVEQVNQVGWYPSTQRSHPEWIRKVDVKVKSGSWFCFEIITSLWDRYFSCQIQWVMDTLACLVAACKSNHCKVQVGHATEIAPFTFPPLLNTPSSGFLDL